MLTYLLMKLSAATYIDYGFPVLDEDLSMFECSEEKYENQTWSHAFSIAVEAQYYMDTGEMISVDPKSFTQSLKNYYSNKIDLTDFEREHCVNSTENMYPSCIATWINETHPGITFYNGSESDLYLNQAFSVNYTTSPKLLFDTFNSSRVMIGSYRYEIVDDAVRFKGLGASIALSVIPEDEHIEIYGVYSTPGRNCRLFGLSTFYVTDLNFDTNYFEFSHSSGTLYVPPDLNTYTFTISRIVHPGPTPAMTLEPTAVMTPEPSSESTAEFTNETVNETINEATNETTVDQNSSTTPSSSKKTLAIVLGVVGGVIVIVVVTIVIVFTCKKKNEEDETPEGDDKIEV